MFDRFSDDAKDAVQIAREFASKHGSESLENLHLLAGCCRARGSLAARVLLACGQDPIEVCARAEASATQHRSPRPAGEPLPFSENAKRALQFMLEEAYSSGHGWFGTHHLLLGLLRDEGRAAELLKRGGLRLLDARKAAVEVHAAWEKTQPAADLGTQRTVRITTVREAARICAQLDELDLASKLRDLAQRLEQPR
jgi:ATP-dependent Clp protease ATP-binding subunit ClpA